MPVYNSGEFLSKAIESILAQSLRDIELILVDDGSTDGSSGLCDSYAESDSRVIVIHKKNGGICSARNEAIEIARGKYLAFSDHDDEYLPGFLECVYSEACAHDADLVKVGKREYIIQSGKVVREMSESIPYKVFHASDIRDAYFDLVDSRSLDCVWDGLYRKKLLDDNNIRFDTTYKHGGEDIDFNQRFLPHLDVLVSIDKCFYLHYIRKGFSTSSKFNQENILMFEKKMTVINNSIQELHIPLETHTFEYTYMLFRQYVVNLCAYYSSRQLEMSKTKRIRALDEIRKSPFFFAFCDQQSSICFFRKSLKYGLLYFSYKYRLFRFILWLFRTL